MPKFRRKTPVNHFGNKGDGSASAAAYHDSTGNISTRRILRKEKKNFQRDVYEEAKREYRDNYTSAVNYEKQLADYKRGRTEYTAGYVDAVVNAYESQYMDGIDPSNVTAVATLDDVSSELNSKFRTQVKAQVEEITNINQRLADPSDFASDEHVNQVKNELRDLKLTQAKLKRLDNYDRLSIGGIYTASVTANSSLHSVTTNQYKDFCKDEVLGGTVENAQLQLAKHYNVLNHMDDMDNLNILDLGFNNKYHSAKTTESDAEHLARCQQFSADIIRNSRAMADLEDKIKANPFDAFSAETLKRLKTVNNQEGNDYMKWCSDNHKDPIVIMPRFNNLGDGAGAIEFDRPETKDSKVKVNAETLILGQLPTSVSGVSKLVKQGGNLTIAGLEDIGKKLSESSSSYQSAALDGIKTLELQKLASPTFHTKNEVMDPEHDAARALAILNNEEKSDQIFAHSKTSPADLDTAKFSANNKDNRTDLLKAKEAATVLGNVWDVQAGMTTKDFADYCKAKDYTALAAQIKQERISTSPENIAKALAPSVGYLRARKLNYEYNLCADINTELKMKAAAQTHVIDKTFETITKDLNKKNKAVVVYEGKEKEKFGQRVAKAVSRYAPTYSNLILYEYRCKKILYSSSVTIRREIADTYSWADPENEKTKSEKKAEAYNGYLTSSGLSRFFYNVRSGHFTSVSLPVFRAEFFAALYRIRPDRVIGRWLNNIGAVKWFNSVRTGFFNLMSGFKSKISNFLGARVMGFLHASGNLILDAKGYVTNMLRNGLNSLLRKGLKWSWQAIKTVFSAIATFLLGTTLGRIITVASVVIVSSVSFYANSIHGVPYDDIDSHTTYVSNSDNLIVTAEEFMLSEFEDISKAYYTYDHIQITPTKLYALYTSFYTVSDYTSTSEYAAWNASRPSTYAEFTAYKNTLNYKDLIISLPGDVTEAQIKELAILMVEKVETDYSYLPASAYNTDTVTLGVSEAEYNAFKQGGAVTKVGSQSVDTVSGLQTFVSGHLSSYDANYTYMSIVSSSARKSESTVGSMSADEAVKYCQSYGAGTIWRNTYSSDGTNYYSQSDCLAAVIKAAAVTANRYYITYTVGYLTSTTFTKNASDALVYQTGMIKTFFTDLIPSSEKDFTTIYAGSSSAFGVFTSGSPITRGVSYAVTFSNIGDLITRLTVTYSPKEVVTNKSKRTLTFSRPGSSNWLSIDMYDLYKRLGLIVCSDPTVDTCSSYTYVYDDALNDKRLAAGMSSSVIYEGGYITAINNLIGLKYAYLSAEYGDSDYSVPVYFRNILTQWPIDTDSSHNVSISQYYGYSAYQGSFHYAYDLTPTYCAGSISSHSSYLNASGITTKVVRCVIYAQGTGVVTEAYDGNCKEEHISYYGDSYSCKTGRGNYVTIRYTIYDSNNVAHYLYIRDQHMFAGSIAVKVGDTVTEGQIIGQMGSSGMSSGKHLHWAVYESDENDNDSSRTYLDGNQVLVEPFFQ